MLMMDCPGEQASSFPANGMQMKYEQAARRPGGRAESSAEREGLGSSFSCRDSARMSSSSLSGSFTPRREDTWPSSREELSPFSNREEIGETGRPAQRASKPWLVGKQYAIVDDVLYFMGLRDTQKLQSILDAHREKGIECYRCFFSVDDLLAERGAAPGNPGAFSLTEYHRFAAEMNKQSISCAHDNKKLVVYSAPDLRARTRAACLLAAWQVLNCGHTPESAWALFARIGSDATFGAHESELDASGGFSLRPLDILSSLNRARKAGIITPAEHDAPGGEGPELVSVVVPGALAVMQAPSGGGGGMERLCEALHRAGAAHVLQLGELAHSGEALEREGIEHVLAGPCGRGTSPSDNTLEALFRTYRKRAGLVAVHCEGGREATTAVLMCIFLMCKHRFTHREAIGYLRAVRPGAVPAGEAWVFLEANQEALWGLGDPDQGGGGGGGSREGQMLRRQVSGGTGLMSILKHSTLGQRAEESYLARVEYERVAEMIDQLAADKLRSDWRNLTERNNGLPPTFGLGSSIRRAFDTYNSAGSTPEPPSRSFWSPAGLLKRASRKANQRVVPRM